MSAIFFCSVQSRIAWGELPFPSMVESCPPRRPRSGGGRLPIYGGSRRHGRRRSRAYWSSMRPRIRRERPQVLESVSRSRTRCTGRSSAESGRRAASRPCGRRTPPSGAREAKRYRVISRITNRPTCRPALALSRAIIARRWSRRKTKSAGLPRPWATGRMMGMSPPWWRGPKPP